MSKRPWKKHAYVKRIVYNNGDVKFETYSALITSPGDPPSYGRFENLDDAIKHLDAWWAAWWPKRIKSQKRVA